MTSSNCCFLICIQISQEAGQVFWYSHLFQSFPVCCDPYSQRLEHSQWSRSRCFSGTLAFSMIQRMLAIWSLLLLPFLNPTWTSGNSWFTYCWSLENFENYFTRVWDEFNCAVVWTVFGIALLWDCSENWPFPILWPLLNFPNLLTYWIQHFMCTYSLISLGWIPRTGITRSYSILNLIKIK